MRRKIFALLVLAVCLLTTLTASAAATVTDVNWGVNQYNVLRFVVDLTEAARYNIDVDGNKLYIRLPRAELSSKVARRSTIKSDLAKSMSVERDNRRVTIEVPLKKRIRRSDVHSFVLRKDPATGRPPRIVIDVTTNKKSVASKRYGATSVRRSQATSWNQNRSVGNAAPVKAYTNYRTGGGLAGKNITIDPGHGGSDPGAIGLKGNKEKTSTLAISNYLRQYLEERGAKVSMTRTTDVDVYGPYASGHDELQARVDVASRNKADVFVSIHHNANNNRSIGGIGTYYYPKTSYDSRLARLVQAQMMKATQMNNYGTPQANFYVVKRSSMPAVLCEIGFISNQREEKLINTPWFQKTIAKAIAAGIAEYFQG
ncbi:MAG: N-acetylmuramoyl-L-alanine amidase family protein [Succiniclasticum sp.]